MIKRILIGILTSGVQTLLYYILIQLAWTVVPKFHEPARMSLAEMVGYTEFLKVSIIGVAIIVVVINLIDALTNRRKWTLLLSILTSLGYSIYFAHDIDYIPLKTLLIITAGLLAIYSKFPIDRLLSKLISTSSKPSPK